MAELAVEIFTHDGALIEEPDTIMMSASTVFFSSWHDFGVLLRITAAFRSPKWFLVWFVFMNKVFLSTKYCGAGRLLNDLRWHAHIFAEIGNRKQTVSFFYMQTCDLLRRLKVC